MFVGVVNLTKTPVAMQKNIRSCSQQIEEEGFFVARNCLSPREISHIKGNITSQYLLRLSEESIPPASFSSHSKLLFPPQSYHEISSSIDHSRLWSKPFRVLDKEFISWFSAGSLMNFLVEQFGKNIDITDEERLGYGNVYWRLVRPQNSRDVGPLHRDKWFWDIDKNQVLPEYPFKRIKCWMPLVPESSLNGLLIVKGSHKDTEITWTQFEKDGRIKPKLVIESLKDHPLRADLDVGDVLIFHDELVHGGSINESRFTRISLEFTVFVKL